MNALAVVQPPKRERKRPNRSEAKIVANARDIMALLHRDATAPKTTPLVRASLARAYAVLGDAIRVWRGIPSPGQLRPDLDPVQLSRALKRSKHRLPILELANAKHFEAPEEAPAPAPDAATKKVKESLSQTGTVPAPPPPGEP